MQQAPTPPRRLNVDADDALCRRWRDQHDIQAAQVLVEHYRHLVVDIAAAYHARHLPPETLLGEGYVGLMRAICRFDPDSGIHFSTYAISWISAAIQDRLLHQAQAADRANTGGIASVARRYHEDAPVSQP
jgi:RNA polymerase sigma-32 factor